QAEHGGWARKVEVVPELSGNDKPFGDAFARPGGLLTFTRWINYNNANPNATVSGDQDIGLITLDRNIGNQTGWMSFGDRFSFFYLLNTAGYPGAPYDGQHMYRDFGVAVSDLNGSMRYSDGKIKGQSGSPMWTYNAYTGERVIYGVFVG